MEVEVARQEGVEPPTNRIGISWYSIFLRTWLILKIFKWLIFNVYCFLLLFDAHGCILVDGT